MSSGAAGKLRLKCDGTRAETTFRLSAEGTSPFKSEGASVQSTTRSRGVRISGSNAGYTMFRSSMKGTGYPLHSPVSPSLTLPCVVTFQLDSASRKMQMRKLSLCSVGQKLHFLAPSQDLRKVAISLVPSVCMKQLGPDWADFRKFYLTKKKLPM
jgi:hypothetical protein